MPTINVTKEAHDLIRAHAELPFRDTARRLPSGEFEIPVGDDVFERLSQIRMEGETWSDVLTRAFATMDGKRPN